jgi:hypothetical protein
MSSWFNPKSSLSTKNSDFFVGINIFKKMSNSYFGIITNTMNEIFDKEDLKDYILPKVIVIGNESSGKSSLLENITKCQIFPRNSGTCTKCPIHVILKNSSIKEYSIMYKNQLIVLDKNNIHDIISKYFLEIGDFISDEEIIINISEPELPTFEFYDLPGIVSYPPENAKQTLELSRKYLSNKNTIVLCVVPATTTRLTSCQSIALIKELNMEKNSIIALTMVDRIQICNIEELLINRLLETSNEIKELNFHSYIAIINRTHYDTFSLEENDTNEFKWFQDNILSKIPDTHKEEGEKISKNITINNLVKKLDVLYSEYIDREWKPSILDKIDIKKKEVKLKYKLLGEEPHSINKKEMFKVIKEVVFNILIEHRGSFNCSLNLDDDINKFLYNFIKNKSSIYSSPKYYYYSFFKKYVKNLSNLENKKKIIQHFINQESCNLFFDNNNYDYDDNSYKDDINYYLTFIKTANFALINAKTKTKEAKEILDKLDNNNNRKKYEEIKKLEDKATNNVIRTINALESAKTRSNFSNKYSIKTSDFDIKQKYVYDFKFIHEQFNNDYNIHKFFYGTSTFFDNSENIDIVEDISEENKQKLSKYVLKRFTYLENKINNIIYTSFLDNFIKNEKQIQNYLYNVLDNIYCEEEEKGFLSFDDKNFIMKFNKQMTNSMMLFVFDEFLHNFDELLILNDEDVVENDNTIKERKLLNTKYEKLLNTKYDKLLNTKYEKSLNTKYEKSLGHDTNCCFSDIKFMKKSSI